jgi:hypothetical protein
VEEGERRLEAVLLEVEDRTNYGCDKRQGLPSAVVGNGFWTPHLSKKQEKERKKDFHIEQKQQNGILAPQ